LDPGTTQLYDRWEMAARTTVLSNPSDRARDRATLRVTKSAVRTDYFAALVQRIHLLRQPRGPGQPMLWIQRLRGWSDNDLAGAILYHLLRVTIWTEEEYDPHDPPYVLTVGTALGAALLGHDADRVEEVGVQLLLDVAQEAGIVETIHNLGRGGIRIRVTDDLFALTQLHVNEAARRSILSHRPVHPPTEVITRRPLNMLEERPPNPPRVIQAVNKLQGTAWRINRALLEKLGPLSDAAIAARLHSEPPSRDEGVLLEAHVLAPLDRFYIPMHLDSRGRVYQDGGLLTYTSGSDFARGLLEFADGVQLNGNEGNALDWLAWHAAQMWGNVKDDPAPTLPLGYGWPWASEATKRAERWREAEHPAQFLAAALALVDAQAGRPVHVPVRVDATCSGLQHLALLSRDVELAKTVNLWETVPGAGTLDRSVTAMFVGPGQEPDFYAAVARASGFTRKETKAVIVPLLYGAGDKATGEHKHRYALSKALARARRGETARRTDKDSRDVTEIRSKARALARRVFSDVLPWFVRVAEAHNHLTVIEETHRDRRGRDRTRMRRVPVGPAAVRWTTPSGFEVIQDYRYIDKNPKRSDRQVKVRLSHGHVVNLVRRFYTDAIDTRRQVTSIQANVVHSMDAALLVELVARTPIERWAVAHDAFGVPANRVWELLAANEVAMRVMYETDRLAEWTAAWRRAGVEVPDPPAHSERLPPEMLKGLRTLG
jgi:hypothetical protein